MDLTCQLADLLVVWTEVVVAVQLGQLDAAAVVLGVRATSGQVCVQLRAEHLDAARRQTLHNRQRNGATANLR